MFDTKMFPLGREFDNKKGQNVKSPWVYPVPLPGGLTLTDALNTLEMEVCVISMNYSKVCHSTEILPFLKLTQ